MPLDLTELVDPRHTALVTQECQRGVMGDLSPLPELAAAAKGEVTANIARLMTAARDAGVPVLHCLALRRADGLGSSSNARIFQYMARSEPKLLPGSDAAALVPEIEPAESDMVLSRLHGLSPFAGTDLDPILRNLGVRTVVGVGVSANVAIPNFAFDAVNAGYQVVLVRDAVAGFPADYVDAVFTHTLAAVATVTDTPSLLACWGGRSLRS